MEMNENWGKTKYKMPNYVPNEWLDKILSGLLSRQSAAEICQLSHSRSPAQQHQLIHSFLDQLKVWMILSNLPAMTAGKLNICT